MEESACSMCGYGRALVPVGAGAAGKQKAYCDRCKELIGCPHCLACGQLVREAGRNAAEPYHAGCSRCTSCCLVVPLGEARNVAGKLLCGSCADLFGKFFLPNHQSKPDCDEDIDLVKSAFSAWDTGGDGTIDKLELLLVIKALDPDFSDKDADRLLRLADKNGSGLVELADFCHWIEDEEPVKITEGFDEVLEQLMKDAGKAQKHFKLSIAEIQVRPDGLLFLTRGGERRFECRCFHSPKLELTVLDPEEFISKVECTGSHVILGMNTGRVARLPGQVDQCFGPWHAPKGFHAVGLRTKPLEAKARTKLCHDRVVGLSLAPLPTAQAYDAAAALRFAAENEHLLAMRDLLSRGGVDVNTFGEGGINPLMLAATHGNIGSMRLLLNCKAKINVADNDGWTALTFASNFGMTSAVHLLLDRGATKAGDGGAALREAVRHQHNSAARALLRAGFGPAPHGTFALEKVITKAMCALEAPVVTPAAGSYSAPVTVKLHCPGNPKARILFTLDGRDPFEAGAMYRTPLIISDLRTRLRAVTVRSGGAYGGGRSLHMDELFYVSNYVLPDEVVSGTLNVSTIPEARDILRAKLAAHLNAPTERVAMEATNREQPNDGTKWIRVPVKNPKPKHRLIFNVKHTTVRKPEQANRFIAKITRDLVHKHACGEKPESATITNHKKNVAMEFTMSRVASDVVASQLKDPDSYLRHHARCHALWCGASYEDFDLLGDHLMKPDLYTYLRQLMGKASPAQQIVGVGVGDSGTLGFKMTKCNKKLKEKITKAIKDSLPQVEQESMKESPSELQFDYLVDVVSNQTTDGSKVAQCLGNETFSEKFNEEVAEALPSQVVTAQAGATATQLHRLQFRLEWEMATKAGHHATEVGPIQPFCDGFCLVYADVRMIKLIDLNPKGKQEHVDEVAAMRHASHGEVGEANHEDERNLARLRRALGRAVWCGGENILGSGGSRMCEVDLHAVPVEITDVYFVLAGGPADTLAPFPRLSMHVCDATSSRQLSEHVINTEDSHHNDVAEAHSVVMCALSRPSGSQTWMVHHLAIPTIGSLRAHDPVNKATLALQASYDRWTRRKSLIQLRILYKLKWISRDSSSKLADLLWAILNLSTTCFQALCTMF